MRQLISHEKHKKRKKFLLDALAESGSSVQRPLMYHLSVM